jgi:hypothetical protein
MITGRWTGYRYTAGRNTGEVTQVVAVDEKLPPEEVPEDELLPPHVDVVEATFTAYALTSFQRPCPPGYSIGHIDITAGTLGAWVERDGQQLALSNNHVLANSNAGRVGDTIVQPGRADDPQSPRFGVLHDFTPIVFQDKKKLAGLWWRLWKGIGNTGARAVGCTFRLVVVQQAANLVDAALCLPDDPSHVEREFPEWGLPKGARTLLLGDNVKKVGRTTEHTFGVVEGVGATISVQYGAGQIAEFEDQVIIRGDGEFSAPGDSGSAILTDEDMAVGGLLFAGGNGITVANRFENVQALLGVEL